MREIICDISTKDEIKRFQEWITEKHIKNQDKFDTGVISMDVEDVKASYYDVMRMAGKIVIERPGIQVFKTRIDDRAVPGIREDGWKQTPGKIMFGDGITWTGIISLPYKRDKNGNYLIRSIEVQPGLFKVLKDLPVCTGVGVRQDVVGIEEFYSILSGETVELNGFVDLSAMAAAAGYQFRARNMTAMGVQILGTVLNKTVSTGDDSWGVPWNELPRSLQVYGIGDIRFGFICYNVLAGIIARDLFPEPEIVGKILRTEQRGAISWILEWIVKSLEGVELHQRADEDATTRGELLSALRFRNSRNKIDISPPPYIVLWSKLIGDWPSIVNGGCRFALQARMKFIDQVRILAKSNITWNHGRILLGLGLEEINYATFGIPVEDLRVALWNDPTSSRRGLGRPSSMEAGMLKFNPTTVMYSTISKFCSKN